MKKFIFAISLVGFLGIGCFLVINNWQQIRSFIESADTQQLETNETAKETPPPLSELEKRYKLAVNLKLGEQTFSIDSEEIMGWYSQEEAGIFLDQELVIDYVYEFGREQNAFLGNVEETANSIKAALLKLEPANIAVNKIAETINLTYCVLSKGVSEDHLQDLELKAKAVYKDSRGWAGTGKYSFLQVEQGCSFVLWLASPEQVAAFSSGCSSMWSCRVGPNVVINFDRWQNASPAWVASGGNLDDYRTMVINHETGHYLGFDHFFCENPGDLAPVMQQQSIELGGCKFNPWPLKMEMDLL